MDRRSYQSVAFAMRGDEKARCPCDQTLQTRQFSRELYTPAQPKYDAHKVCRIIARHEVHDGSRPSGVSNDVSSTSVPLKYRRNTRALGITNDQKGNLMLDAGTDLVVSSTWLTDLICGLEPDHRRLYLYVLFRYPATPWTRIRANVDDNTNRRMVRCLPDLVVHYSVLLQLPTNRFRRQSHSGNDIWNVASRMCHRTSHSYRVRITSHEAAAVTGWRPLCDSTKGSTK
jgi:hypothetical protein